MCFRSQGIYVDCNRTAKEEDYCLRKKRIESGERGMLYVASRGRKFLEEERD
jgi:hypothetical protein